MSQYLSTSTIIMPVNIKINSGGSVSITSDSLTQLKQKGYKTIAENIPQAIVLISVADQECDGHRKDLITTKKVEIENQNKIIKETQTNYSNTTIYRLITDGDLFNDKSTRSLKSKTSKYGVTF